MNSLVLQYSAPLAAREFQFFEHVDVAGKAPKLYPAAAVLLVAGLVGFSRWRREDFLVNGSIYAAKSSYAQAWHLNALYYDLARYSMAIDVREPIAAQPG